MSRLRKLRNRRGFTVIELSICAVVVAALMVTLSALLNSSINGWSSGSSKAGAASAASVAAHKLWQEVRVGKSALAFSGTQLYVIVPPLVTDVNGETYYDLAATGSVHKYYVYNKNLYRQIGTATPTIFARRISNIEVGVSGPTVTVTLTSDEQVGASASQVVYAQEIVMRNCNN